MTTAAEAGIARNAFGSAAAEALELLSENQTITFTRYVRLVLPYDGYVFWVKSDLIAPGALYNAAPVGTFMLNQPYKVAAGAKTVTVKGSLHYSVDQYQIKDESFSLNRVVFTSEEEVEDLNDIAPDVLYIGEFNGLRFAFSQLGSFYEQAELWHYRGDAIYPVMETQIIDSPEQLDLKNIIVSNSLPIWLALNSFMPMFPSYLVPDNIRPPYGAVDIKPEDTNFLQAIPGLNAKGSHFQLVTDKVEVTLYGLRNYSALDYMDYVLKYIDENDDVMGLMDVTPVRDEKRSQNETTTLSQKKTINFQVSYYQTRIQATTRQLINRCIPSITVEEVPVFAG